MSVKWFLIKRLVFLLSKLNNKNKRDFLDKVQEIVFFAKGRDRGFYKIEFEVKICVDLINTFFDANKTINGTIIDVGANRGQYTDIILKSLPKLDYNLYEPNKELYSELIKKYVNNDNVLVSNFALSDENKIADFFLTDEDGMNSLYDRKHEVSNSITSHFKRSKDKVSVKRFDELESKIDFIPLIKIDAEGSELSVIKGFGNYLENTLLIQFEWGRAQLDSKNTFKNFYDYLKKFNFDLYIIHPSGIKKITKYSLQEEIYIASNFVCINKNLMNN